MTLTIIIILTLIGLPIYILFCRQLFEKMGWVRPLPADFASWRDRIAAWARRSTTVAVAKLQIVFGTLLEVLINAGEAFNLPEVKEQLHAVGLGRGLSIALIVLGVITYFARMRTLPRESASSWER